MPLRSCSKNRSTSNNSHIFLRGSDSCCQELVTVTFDEDNPRDPMNWSTRVKHAEVAILCMLSFVVFCGDLFRCGLTDLARVLGSSYVCHFVFKRSLYRGWHTGTSAVVFDGEIQHKHCSNSTSVTRRFFSDDLRTLLLQCCMLQNELRYCRIRHWRTPGKLTRTYVNRPRDSPSLSLFFLGSLLSLLTPSFS
jgi:hypothetical protein